MPNDKLRDNTIKKTFWESIIIHKLSKPVVLIFLLLASLCISFLVAKQGIITGAFILVLIIGVPLVYAIVVNPKIGILALMAVAFFINYVSRFLPEDTPIGTLMDAMTYLLLLGFFLKQRDERRWDYFKTPIGYFMLAWLFFNLIEAVNPTADSIMAWAYTVRTLAFILLMYFVFVFQIRTKEFIKLIFKVWLAFELIAALSAFQQENIGFFPFEQKWLTADPLRLQLLFIYGHMRKFGIFSDPVVFAYNMVISSLLCVSLLFTNITTVKKVILVFMICFFIMVMMYSGTRASYVLIPAAIVMVAILKFNRRVLVAVIIGSLFLGVLIKIPNSNPSLVRFQSAFKPSKDASFEVRAENQRRIKPYILAHPLGGGLGSTGVWGQRFSPNSYLSKFPPDSGYVRVAVEMGWLGLLIFCLYYFTILYQGIHFYFYIKDPELKAWCMGMVLVIFALGIGNYPQQALVQYPTNILFYLAAALLNILMRLDIEQREPALQQLRH